MLPPYRQYGLTDSAHYALCECGLCYFAFCAEQSHAIDAGLMTNGSMCNYEITLISNTVTEISDKLSVTPIKFDAT